MTFHEWLKSAHEYAANQAPVQRCGQALFNHLYSWRPYIADQLRGDGPDPFYRDDKISAFLEFVEERWDEDVPPPQVDGTSPSPALAKKD